MKHQRFKRGRIYRRRRTAILSVTVAILVWLGASYLGSEDNNGDMGDKDLTLFPTVTISPTSVETLEHGILPVTSTVTKSGKMDIIRTKVEKYTSQLPGKYGISFIDLATGEYFGINDRDSYIAASTSKLPMNVLLYTKIEVGEVDAEAKLKYLEEDYEPGTGIIQNQPFGTEFTVREASRLSIVYSDNCAINMIIRILGIEEICQYILDLGGDIYYDDGHLTSPHDLVIVAKELYRLYLFNPDLYGELIYNLENTSWNDRIKAQLPDDVRVAHKIGNQIRTVNDVGIVFASHPFALAVMVEVAENETDSESLSSYEIASENIAKISRMIYDEVELYSR